MGDVESADADNPPALGAGQVVLWVGHLFLVYLAQGVLTGGTDPGDRTQGQNPMRATTPG
jgi:hypothetical protein